MIDSHTHLSDPAFETDRNDIIKLSENSGIKIFLEILTSSKDWEKYKIFEKNKNFYFAFGIHPHYIDEFSNDNIRKLENYIKLQNCIALGETGIDLFYHPENLKNSLKLFETMIEISFKFNKPLILHIRNSKTGESAYKIAYNFLKEREKMINKKGVVHSFSGTIEEAKKFLDLGFFLGINATITYPKNNKLIDIIKYTSLENILTETDCPYLPPQRIRGKRNDPRSIIDIVEKISEIKKLDKKKVEEVTESNFYRFLNQLV